MGEPMPVPDSAEIDDLARRVLDACRSRGLHLATAESCTGGLICGALTEIAGSSDVVACGFVTYDNAAKTRMLGVDAGLLARLGAVCEPVARAMAEGALAHAPVDLTVAVTGIAGPGGGSAKKPVGLVHFASARRDGPVHAEHHVFAGDRAAVRRQTVATALRLLLDRATA